MPFYAYILRRSNGTLYYGSTGNIAARLAEHRRSYVRSTRPFRPVELVWFEEHETEDEARRKEFSLKNGRTRRRTINALISDFPPEQLAPYRDS